MAAAATAERPISIGGLAERLGVTRQRIYNLVNRGQIKTVSINGTMVIPANEVSRVCDAAIKLDTRKGTRLVFDFV